MSKSKVRLLSASVMAGFPSPADDFVERSLDLNELLIKRPASTFIVRVAGDSMIGVGIHSGDLLVVDRSLKHKSGSIVVAVVDGDLTLKRLVYQNKSWGLFAENPAYRPIVLAEKSDFSIWGVVSSVIKIFESR